MDYQEIIEKIKPELDKVMEYLGQELSEIRAGRPSSSLVESIEIDYFGKKFPLKSLGNISLSQNREIIIQPWDDSYLQPIEKAIFSSPLGLSPIIKGDVVCISFPPMTQDMRKKLTILVSEKAESTMRTIRHWRQDAKRQIEKAFTDGEIGEDSKYKGIKKLEDVIKEYRKKAEELIDKKKTEIID